MPSATTSRKCFPPDDGPCCLRDLLTKAVARDGIAYLKSVTGTPVNGPGPGTCNRVSCSYNSAIYWCNDVSRLLPPPPKSSPSKAIMMSPESQWLTVVLFKNPTEYVLDNFTLIANGAQQVMNECSFQQVNNVCNDAINGQQFYSGGWNVIVEGDTC